ncbi:MAG: hypothetical protein KKD44_08550 [Proteobacteria bacterium]|nr:hypothetical protein [Pseudomonadota bacterium]
MKTTSLLETIFENGRGDDTFIFFGKRFSRLRTTNHHRMVLHSDYPLIRPDHIDAFGAYSQSQVGIVVTACRSDVHPYRLMRVDETGHEQYVMDVQRDIRGSRQKYPLVYSIKPALIFLPSGFAFDRAPDDIRIDLFIMDRDILRDRAKPLEALMIKE